MIPVGTRVKVRPDASGHKSWKGATGTVVGHDLRYNTVFIGSHTVSFYDTDLDIIEPATQYEAKTIVQPADDDLKEDQAFLDRALLMCMQGMMIRPGVSYTLEHIISTSNDIAQELLRIRNDNKLTNKTREDAGNKE